MTDPAEFRLMTVHGEAARVPTSGGSVIFSKLGGGSSRITALAPSVKFVLQGEEIYAVGGRTHRLAAGDFMLVEAGTEVTVKTGPGGETLGLCVYLPARERPLPTVDAPTNPVVRGSAVDPFAALLKRYASALVRKSAPSPRLIDLLCREASAGSDAFLQRFDANRNRLSHARPAARAEILQRLERARALIHANVHRPVTLEELSREAALSRFHLVRTFSEVYGRPPLSYHRRLRLEDAASLLRLGALSPTQVAEKLGYANLSGFTRAFRSEFGVPPSRL